MSALLGGGVWGGELSWISKSSFGLTCVACDANLDYHSMETLRPWPKVCVSSHKVQDNGWQSRHAAREWLSGAHGHVELHSMSTSRPRPKGAFPLPQVSTQALDSTSASDARERRGGGAFLEFTRTFAPACLARGANARWHSMSNSHHWTKGVLFPSLRDQD